MSPVTPGRKDSRETVLLSFYRLFLENTIVFVTQLTLCPWLCDMIFPFTFFFFANMAKETCILSGHCLQLWSNIFQVDKLANSFLLDNYFFLILYFLYSHKSTKHICAHSQIFYTSSFTVKGDGGPQCLLTDTYQVCHRYVILTCKVFITPMAILAEFPSLCCKRPSSTSRQTDINHPLFEGRRVKLNSRIKAMRF